MRATRLYGLLRQSVRRSVSQLVIQSVVRSVGVSYAASFKNAFQTCRQTHHLSDRRMDVRHVLYRDISYTRDLVVLIYDEFRRFSRSCYGRMDRRTDRWTDGQTDGRMDKQPTNQPTDIRITVYGSIPVPVRLLEIDYLFQKRL